MFVLPSLLSIAFPLPQNITLAALVALSLFVVLAAIVSPISTDGGYQLRQLKDKSALILIACIPIGYGNLLGSGELPRLCNRTYPRGYQNLIESGVTSSDQNKYKEFKKRYEDFLERNSC